MNFAVNYRAASPLAHELWAEIIHPASLTANESAFLAAIVRALATGTRHYHRPANNPVPINALEGWASAPRLLAGLVGKRLAFTAGRTCGITLAGTAALAREARARRRAEILLADLSKFCGI